MEESLQKKLEILAEGAKYDVSCSSSGVNRSSNKKGIGSSKSFGICHTWSADGRCVSLLKILMTNHCIYDCSYCVNRCSNDVERASLTPEEIARITIEFYRRNYIEGLFLSSAIEKSPGETMESMYRVLLLLRNTYQFNGYIHVKAIPGADDALIKQCGYLADRMSVNIELPTKSSLALLAPQKTFDKILPPMKHIQDIRQEHDDERKHLKKTPSFVPAGQSTQMIIGATPDTDKSILQVSERLYKDFSLKRVYYSAYTPVNEGKHLPSLFTEPPMLREHRLYQADWLLRYYHFTVKELFDGEQANMDTRMDPKLSWALKNIHLFPVEINHAPLELLIRIPGIGHTSAYKIIRQRRCAALSFDQLKKTGCVLKKAKHFVTCRGKYYGESLEPQMLQNLFLPKESHYEQLRFF